MVCTKSTKKKKILLCSSNTHDCKCLCAHKPSDVFHILILFMWNDDLWFIDCHSPALYITLFWILTKVWEKYMIRKKTFLQTISCATWYEIFFVKKERKTLLTAQTDYPLTGVCAADDLVTELVRSRLVGLRWGLYATSIQTELFWLPVSEGRNLLLFVFAFIYYVTVTVGGERMWDWWYVSVFLSKVYMCCFPPGVILFCSWAVISEWLKKKMWRLWDI